MSALDPHQRGDLTLLVRFLDVFRLGRQDEIVGITSNNVVAHRIDHLQRPIRRAVTVHIGRRHIDRKELGPYAALFQPPDIGVPGTAARSEVESFHGPAGNVVMGIDKQRRPVYSHHLGVGDGPGLSSGQHYRNQGQEKAGPHKYLL